MKKQKAKYVLNDPGYRVWGLTVIKWNDGKYHGYYSRWPESKGHDAWLSHSEIAHAVADSPEGPFVFKEVVLKSQNPNGWDMLNAHNPYICYDGKQLCLYYISNDIRKIFAKNNATLPLSDDWILEHKGKYRNTQRIGVAIAQNPSGPFTRHKEIVVGPNNYLKEVAVNPAVTYQNGKYIMIMKGDDMRKEKRFRIQYVGIADKPEGPFEIFEKPVFDKVQSEDACIWYNKKTKQYNMVCHVMGQNNLAYFTSTNKLNWQPAEQEVFMKKEILLEDGTVWKPKRVERPFVLTDKNGVPVMFYVAVSGQDINGNIAIPILNNKNN
jgi:hypothetical protein